MEQFKRAQVIMLPTENKTNIILNPTTNKLSIPKELSIGTDNLKRCIEVGFKPKHLYIISDNEIKEGDWFISTEFDIVGQLQKGEKITTEKVKKIIATTDTSLHIPYVTPGNEDLDIYEYSILPQPSQQFIEKYIESYNKSNVGSNNFTITDVLVEMEIDEEIAGYEHSYLKINPKDNTITIKKLKDSWNREEILNFGLQCGIAGTLAERNKVDFNKLYLELVEKHL